MLRMKTKINPTSAFIQFDRSYYYVCLNSDSDPQCFKIQRHKPASKTQLQTQEENCFQMLAYPTPYTAFYNGETKLLLIKTKGLSVEMNLI
jgi:hypothetical protein